MSEKDEITAPGVVDYLSNFAQGASAIFAGYSADPFVGAIVVSVSSISNLMLAKNTPYIEGKLRKLVGSISVGLSQSEVVRKYDFKSFSVEDWDRITAMIMQLVQTAVKSKDEKIEVLRNAILNAAISHEPDQDMHFMFVRYIDEFTGSQVEMLSYLATNELPIENRSHLGYYVGAKIHEAMRSVNPKYENISFTTALIRDLEHHALINVMAHYTEEQPNHRCLTTLGARFLDFITLP